MKIQRTLPPVGAPLNLKDLLFGIAGMLRPSKALRKFEEELQAYFGVKHVFLVSSGKAALTLILHTLNELTGKVEVVIPSYTCFSVPSAVVRAGLKPVICDIKENDFNYDERRLAELVNQNTLCVIATHLFGIPCEMEPIVSAAKSTGAWVVEDAAQAMGAELEGKKAGTLGDVGFFSLGRGKCLSTVSGGIITTDDDRLADSLLRKIQSLKGPSLIDQLTTLGVAVFLYIFSRPSLYWFPAGLPFLKLGQTIYSTQFPLKKLGGLNAGLAANWRKKLEAFNQARRENANAYRSALDESGLLLIQEPAHSSATWLRFPVVANTPEQRDELLARLTAVGLGASPNYPTGIAEIPELAVSKAVRVRCRNGNILASRILTLATHSGVRPSMMDEMRKTMWSGRNIPDLPFERQTS
ncbi:MAG: hypothetical protein Kow0099_26690 [Candidatus Abyssubacteria bacterium]